MANIEIPGLTALAQSIIAAPVNLFIGAGISIAPPTLAPDWNSFSQRLLHAIVGRVPDTVWPERGMRQIYDRFSTSPPRPELLMEVIRQNTSLPGEAFSEIVGCLGSLAANPNHFFVANLAGAGRVNAIITTNFDECIETALSAVGIRFRCFATDEEFAELAYILDRQMRTMFLPVTKIHGSVRDHRSIVMTLRDSARPLQEQKAHCLTQLINGRDLLVHGYSGRDDDIRPFFSTRPRDSAIYTGRSSARPLIARQWTAV